MSQLLLIDGDIPLYQAAFGVEEPIDWGEDLWTLHADVGTAACVFDKWIADVQDYLGNSEILVCFSGKKNWRKSVLPTYKANRLEQRKPVIYTPLRTYIEGNYLSVSHDSLEADDILGILSGGDRIIVSIDKDMKTIPGYHFNPRHPEEGITKISQDVADYNHMSQTLTGDSTDGYKGCPGVGVKRAERLLGELEGEDMWPVVLEAFTRAKLSEDEALKQARVSYILRPGDYDYHRKEVKLWQPQEQ